MSRQRDSTRARRITYDTHRKKDHLDRWYMDCRCGRGLRPDCGQRIDPTLTSTWPAHHNIPWAEGGEDTPENLFPILTKSDVEKTAPEDTSRIAKNVRIRERHEGIRTRGSSFATNRNGRFKKKISGEVVER